MLTSPDFRLQLGVNTIAPFLLTKLLNPLLISTARTAPRNTVRVVWVSSSAAEFIGTVPMDNLDYHINKGATYKYGVSKAGNYLHAVEFAKRYAHEGIVSVPLNPGNLSSELLRYHSAVFQKIGKVVVLYPTVMGAYTELFAALSPEVTLERSGDWGM
jgi:retinol dehydrogenase-12